jgi:MFS family permease
VSDAPPPPPAPPLVQHGWGDHRPVPPEHEVNAAATTARAERWARVVVGSLALLSVTPAAYYWGERRRDSLDDFLIDLGRDLSAEETDPAKLLDQGAVAVAMAALAIGLVCFAALMMLRRRAVRKMVAGSPPGARPQRPPVALHLTVAAWGVLLVAAFVGGTPQYVAGDEALGKDASTLIDQPAWMLLAVPGLAIAVAMSDFVLRRRHGLFTARQLEAAPTSDPLAAELPRREGAPGSSAGLQAFIVSAVFSVALGLAHYLDALVFDDGPGFSDFAAACVYGIILFPAVIAGVFLLMLFVFAPTRRFVRESLRQPWALASLGLMGGALLGDALDLPAAVPVIMVIAGGLIGSVTGLYVQDVGPQPWLGLAFIIFSFTLNFTNDAGDIAPPTSWIGWGAGAATAVYALYEARKLWRTKVPAPVAATS